MGFADRTQSLLCDRPLRAAAVRRRVPRAATRSRIDLTSQEHFEPYSIPRSSGGGFSKLPREGLGGPPPNRKEIHHSALRRIRAIKRGRESITAVKPNGGAYTKFLEPDAPDDFGVVRTTQAIP